MGAEPRDLSKSCCPFNDSAANRHVSQPLIGGTSAQKGGIDAHFQAGRRGHIMGASLSAEFDHGDK
jgi:hypothetical protein